jgi:methionyl aminopeptidase
MTVPLSALRGEIKKRVANTKKLMGERGYDALIVYASNKVNGSVRYLTDYFPDRAGWISLSDKETAIVEGAAVVITPASGTQLLVDPGLMPTREICADQIIEGEGFAAKLGDGLSVGNLGALIKDGASPKRVGIETYDKFPAPLLLGLMKEFPKTEFVRSTIVEELRLIKSEFDLDMCRRGGRVADLGHRTFFNALVDGVGRTELELIRLTEHAMRSADPIYEDSVSSSPSMICSGYATSGALLHHPSPTKRIEMGDIVHWDICMRYAGYPVDSSRTRALGKVSDSHRRCYDTILEIHEEIVRSAKPGVLAGDLTKKAASMAEKNGYVLWNRFIGHGLGWDLHERPDMGTEATPLAENMLLAIEPRLTADDIYLLGNEDMVVVTPAGGVSLTAFPKEPLEIT